MGKRNGPEIFQNLTMTNSCPSKGRTPCTYRQQHGGLPDWRAALQKRPAGGSQWTISWKESAGTTIKVVRGSGEALALRLVLPGFFSRWLQGGPYSSSPIPMGSPEKEPGPFVVVYGSRVKHNRHKLHNNQDVQTGCEEKLFLHKDSQCHRLHNVAVHLPSSVESWLHKALSSLA